MRERNVGFSSDGHFYVTFSIMDTDTNGDIIYMTLRNLALFRKETIRFT